MENYAIVFDLDETIGHFSQLYNFWNLLSIYLNKELEQKYFNNLIDLFPLFLRPNILSLMKNIKDKKTDDILEKLVHINRITKVVKGGRRFGFSALVVVGNQAGKIGIAHAKAKQVPDAIKKANEMARRKLTHIPLREGRTIHHDVKAKDGSGRIVLRAASKGTGIIAGGPVRAVCEVLGVKDIVAKSMGTSNAHNVIRATMKALMKQSSPKQISAIRNKKISEIIEKRG